MSTAELQQCATKTLRERAEELSLRYHKHINAATLLRYYKRAGITYKSVNLFCTNKLNRADEILR